jgi:hypothetical protein
MKKAITSSKSSATRTGAAPRKLALARETLRHLIAPELAEVVGGGTVVLQPADTCVTCTTGR